MKILTKLYSIWVIFSMVLHFVLFILPLIILISFKSTHVLALRINKLWAWGFFHLAFIPVRMEWRFRLDPQKQYILCANHFSYLDIPALGLFPKPFKFVGKSQLGKVPLFGLMYNNLHITVNRSSYKSRALSLSKARTAIEEGFSLGFFPEGGIRFTEFPMMVNFQDGAFRLAAENNIPIIPVTLLDNCNILRDGDVFEIKRKKCRIVYHKPIEALNDSEEEIKKLKAAVHRVIQDELDEHFRNPVPTS